ncbi:unnamed protein product [Brugia timori]|uniref:Ovule protein n=1 Tax=Brugia timori TaxID=42155 RepID=A0A0R3QBE4_9BILA|nr:unnamed protein product [Brugia timori]
MPSSSGWTSLKSNLKAFPDLTDLIRLDFSTLLNPLNHCTVQSSPFSISRTNLQGVEDLTVTDCGSLQTARSFCLSKMELQLHFIKPAKINIALNITSSGATFQFVIPK